MRDIILYDNGAQTVRLDICSDFAWFEVLDGIGEHTSDKRLLDRRRYLANLIAGKFMELEGERMELQRRNKEIETQLKAQTTQINGLAEKIPEYQAKVSDINKKHAKISALVENAGFIERMTKLYKEIKAIL